MSSKVNFGRIADYIDGRAAYIGADPELIAGDTSAEKIGCFVSHISEIFFLSEEDEILTNHDLGVAIMTSFVGQSARIFRNETYSRQRFMRAVNEPRSVDVLTAMARSGNDVSVNLETIYGLHPQFFDRSGRQQLVHAEYGNSDFISLQPEHQHFLNQPSAETVCPYRKFIGHSLFSISLAMANSGIIEYIMQTENPYITKYSEQRQLAGATMSTT